ncbi:3105_t:CDS:2, partial [Gigaspora margarita]
MPKLCVKPKKIRHEETEKTLSDKFSDDHDTENVILSSGESIIEGTESSSIISYISSNEKPGKACDENLDNYQPSYRPLADILDILEEASIDYDESDLDSIYDSRNDEQLFDDMEVLTDSDESNTIEVDDVLEDMFSDFEGFEREYDLNYNYKQNARYYQQMEERFVEIESQGLKADMKWLAVKYRLVKPGLLRMLQWNRHIQTPQNTYYSMAGKARILLEAT